MTTSTPMTQPELESYLWGAATLLRGTIDAGDYKQFIFPLLFWKRLCDVYDEETRRALDWIGEVFPEDHRFQIPDGAHWKEVRSVSVDVGVAIQAAMHAIESANPGALTDIFGDAPWTNKNRLSDSTLKELIEHFSGQVLSMVRVDDDLLGKAYEFLIKKFADDSGHTAAEFYTNRTVVHLMALMLEPQPGESVYDPTCGSGGMLIEAAEKLKRKGRDYRTLHLYGQEINLMTSAMARMNLFLHGFETFEIVRGDTLADPHFHTGNRLQQFDVVLANPPYSIKQWNRARWEKDPYGRNLYGTPPQGRADYAFLQHIIASLKPDTGRCAILFPHGVLFRDEEQHMRERLVQADVVECVVGLGPNLFYNSPMEACVVICRMRKPAARRGKVLLINAVNEVTRERASSFLQEAHIARIVGAYRAFANEDGFARVVENAEVLRQHANLNIPLYVQPSNGNNAPDKSLETVIAEWSASSLDLRESMSGMILALGELAMPKPIIKLEPEMIAAGLVNVATQLNDFGKLVQSSTGSVDALVRAFSRDMADLKLVATPGIGLADQLTAMMPKLDMAALGTSNLIGTVSLAEAIAGKTSTRLAEIWSHATNTLKEAKFWSESAWLNSLVETNAFLVSEEFLGIQNSLALDEQMIAIPQGFLDSIAIGNGAFLKSILGDSDEVATTVDVLVGTRPVDELPPKVLVGASEVRQFSIDNGIVPLALILFAVRVLALFAEEPEFQKMGDLLESLCYVLTTIFIGHKMKKDG